MPIYEYKCDKCRKHHEIMQKITEKPLTVCPSCGGSMKKLISSTSFVLKGSGWYVTDYGDKNRKSSKKEDSEKSDSAQKKEHKKEKTDSSAGKETKKESKSETKPSQKSKE